MFLRLTGLRLSKARLWTTSSPRTFCLDVANPRFVTSGSISSCRIGRYHRNEQDGTDGGTVPGLFASVQPKIDPMTLLGAAAAVQQQQQMQNAQILRSLMEQKQQITKYEDEIRRRMLLPPSFPYFKLTSCKAKWDWWEAWDQTSIIFLFLRARSDNFLL